MLLLAERSDPVVDHALRFALALLEGGGGAFYRVAPDLMPYDYMLIGVPAKFHLCYLGGMHRHDPMTVRRLSARRRLVARFGAADDLASAADYARYQEFCGWFGVTDSVELLFRDGERIFAGLNVAWGGGDVAPASAERNIEPLRAYIEFNLKRCGFAAGGAQPSLASYGLTSREAEVAAQLCRGRTNQEIGKRLGIGLATVKTHLIRIFDKLGVENRAAAVALLAGCRDLNVNQTVDCAGFAPRHIAHASDGATRFAARGLMETSVS